MMLIISGVWDSKWEDCSPGSSSLPGPTCVPEPAGWKKKSCGLRHLTDSQKSSWQPWAITSESSFLPRAEMLYWRQHWFFIRRATGPRCSASSSLLPWKGQGHLGRGLCQDRSKPAWLPPHNFNWDFRKWPEVHPSVIVLNDKLFKILIKRMCSITFANM